MTDLTLTLAERLLLANQLRILQMLKPNEDYSGRIEIVERGYEHLYVELTGDFLEPLPWSICAEVHEILNMFDALHRSLIKLPDKSGIDIEKARFRGFDAVNEYQHRLYAQFMIEKRESYPESKSSKGDYNTRRPILAVYNRMAAEWHAMGRRFDLTRDEVVQIIAAGQEQSAANTST